MFALLTIAVSLFVCYLGAVIFKIGDLPSSISETYYILSRENLLGNVNGKMVFTMFFFAMTFLLLPVMIELVPEPYKWVGFLSVGGLGFVGAASAFRERTVVIVHYAGAGISMVGSVALSLLVPGMDPRGMYTLLGSYILIALFDIMMKGGKFLLWVELGLFMNMFYQLYIMVIDG